MHLVSPDCSQEEAVVQLAHSLGAFQQTVDQIFASAALRTDKCRRRMEQLGRRMETLERKMAAVEKVEDGPVLLNCASNFPELGTSAGLYEPVFGHSVQRFAMRTNDFHRTEENGTERQKKSNSNWVNEGIGRRKDLLAQLFVARDWQRKDKVFLDVDIIQKLSATVGASSNSTLSNSSQSATELLDNVDPFLVRFLSPSAAVGVHHQQKQQQLDNNKMTTPKPTKSAHQIDFSESLIDLCPPLKCIGRPTTATIHGMVDHHGEGGDGDNDDPFAYHGGPTEDDALADIDLPENLPGIDLKSASFVSNPSSIGEASDVRIGHDDTTLTELAKKHDAAKRGDKGPTDLSPLAVLALNTAQSVKSLSAQQTATLAEEFPTQIHAPPPPPPPPSLQQQQQQKKGVVNEAPSSSVSAGGVGRDDRSDLMAAIRAAGGVKGAKLKRVEEDNNDDDDDDTAAAARRSAEGKTSKMGRGDEASTDDLMSSLAKALEMRRKGMLGKGIVTKPKKQPSGGGETLAMLRERVPRIRVESSEENDEGEEERNEWID